ncbi:hypothetical protein Emed_003661 [Eimeria media]
MDISWIVSMLMERSIQNPFIPIPPIFRRASTILSLLFSCRHDAISQSISAGQRSAAALVSSLSRHSSQSKNAGVKKKSQGLVDGAPVRSPQPTDEFAAIKNASWSYLGLPVAVPNITLTGRWLSHTDLPEWCWPLTHTQHVSCVAKTSKAHINDDSAAARARACSLEGSLHQRIGTAVSFVLEEFEAIALQRLDALIHKIRTRRHVYCLQETTLSMQLNGGLLQSLDLESLSTDNLKTVLSLSAELHGQRMCERVTEDFCSASSGITLTGRSAYNLIGGRARKSRAKYAMSPRECVRNAAVSAPPREEAAEATDRRDKFSDFSGSPAQEESHVRTGCSTVCGNTVTDRPQQICPVDAVGCRRPQMLGESAAWGEVAAAAAAAAGFLDVNGRGSDSSSVRLKCTRKRTREDSPTKVPCNDVHDQALMVPAAFSSFLPGALARWCCSWLQPGVPEVATAPLAGVAPTPASFKLERQANDRAPEEFPCGQQFPTLKRRCARRRIVKPDETTTLALETNLKMPALPLLGPYQGLSHGAALCKHKRSNKYKGGEKDTLNFASSVPRVDAPAPSADGSSSASVLSSVVKSTLASWRSPVKGVYYDSFKKLWRAQWHATTDSNGVTVGGKRISRSFNCSRLGYDLARAMAVAWMLSGGRVGDGIIPLISSSGSQQRSLDPFSVCAALAGATSWEQIDDCRVKELVVFYDPKRFLIKIEEFYLSQKVSQAVRLPTLPCQLLSANNSSASSSSPFNSAITAANRGAATAKTLEAASGSAAAAGLARETFAKKTSEGFACDKRESLIPMSLNDMLEVVWGSPRAAAASLFAAEKASAL